MLSSTFLFLFSLLLIIFLLLCLVAFFFLEYSHLNVSEKSMFRLKNILKPFFHKYDCDGNEHLDKHELSAVFVDLGRQHQYIDNGCVR